MNDVKIANWLNENRHLTPPRRNTFRNNYVHSIAKKRKRRLEIVDNQPSTSISDIKFKFRIFKL